MNASAERRDQSGRPEVSGRGSHFAHAPERSTRGRWVALCCAALLLVAVIGGGVAALRLHNNLSTSALNLGEGSGGAENGAMDILVIGSDTRAGSDGKYGDAADRQNTARSDVMMLMQISKDRKKVNVVSFPRDLMVPLPECKDPDSGKKYPAEEIGQINDSLSHGGPGCTVATVSKATGVQIDHFMLVDFNAVKELSATVGGVEVCVTNPVKDEYSGLDIPAGTSQVEGEQALAFLRSRHGFGDGSDTGRIQAQQSFLASLLRKTKAEGTLSNPGRLYDIAEAVTQNTTVDSQLADPSTFVDIGSILSRVDLDQVVFATVPTERYTEDPNRLQLQPEAAGEVFEKLQQDKSLTDGSGEAASPSPSHSPSGSRGPAAPSRRTADAIDHDAPVTLTNATGASGRADRLADQIQKMGYTSVTPYDLDTPLSNTVITYSAGYEAEARQLARRYGVSQAHLSQSEAYVGIAMTLGQDLAKTDKIKKPAHEIAGGASGQTADQAKCQQAFDY